MSDKLQNLLQAGGPFVLILPVAVLIGGTMLVRNVWGFLTGGPRALNEPGAPYLFDRLYYLLWIVGTVGWLLAMVGFFAQELTGTPDADGIPDLFLIGWAIGAIGMGALFFMRREMILRGYRYYATHGSALRRWFNQRQLAQFERQPPWMLKLMSVVFMAVGTAMLLYNLPRLPVAMHQLTAELNALSALFA